MRYIDVLRCLSQKQIQEILFETFKEHVRYHTLDEIQLQKLLDKIPKDICPSCGKTFIHQIDGGKRIDTKNADQTITSVWMCTPCHWKRDDQK
jgi:hypothetical protein